MSTEDIAAKIKANKAEINRLAKENRVLQDKLDDLHDDYIDSMAAQHGMSRSEAETYSHHVDQGWFDWEGNLLSFGFNAGEIVNRQPGWLMANPTLFRNLYLELFRDQWNSPTLDKAVVFDADRNDYLRRFLDLGLGPLTLADRRWIMTFQPDNKKEPVKDGLTFG